MNECSLIRTGKYLTNKIATVNIYENDSLPVASFTGSRLGDLQRSYKIYKKGQLYLDGYFTHNEPDKLWTFYDSTGHISEIRKYDLIDFDMDYYCHVYNLVKYPNGKKYFEYDYKKKLKTYYWENGKVRAQFKAGYKNDSPFTENLYTNTGKLWKTTEYSVEGDVITEKVYDKNQRNIFLF